MRTRTIHELENISRVLQAGLFITSVLTVIAGIVAVKDLAGTVGDSAALATQIDQMISYSFYLAIQVIALLSFRAITTNKTPFLPKVSRNIKIISVLIMLVSPVARWAADLVAWSVSGSPDITLVNAPILLGVLLGLVFAGLASMFDYGCVLQQQDDETL